MFSLLVSLLRVRNNEQTSPWAGRRNSVCLWKRTLLSKWSLFRKENSCTHITGCKTIPSLAPAEENGDQRWWMGWTQAGHTDRASFQRTCAALVFPVWSVTEASSTASHLVHRPSSPNKWQGSSHRAPGNLLQSADDAKWGSDVMHWLEASWTCRPGLVLQILNSVHQGRTPIWRSDSPVVTMMKTQLPLHCHPLLATAPLIDWTVTNQPPSFTEHFSWTVTAVCQALGRGWRGEKVFRPHSAGCEQPDGGLSHHISGSESERVPL